MTSALIDYLAAYGCRPQVQERRQPSSLQMVQEMFTENVRGAFKLIGWCFQCARQTEVWSGAHLLSATASEVGSLVDLTASVASLPDSIFAVCKMCTNFAERQWVPLANNTFKAISRTSEVAMVVITFVGRETSGGLDMAKNGFALASDLTGLYQNIHILILDMLQTDPVVGFASVQNAIRNEAMVAVGSKVAGALLHGTLFFARVLGKGISSTSKFVMGTAYLVSNIALIAFHIRRNNVERDARNRTIGLQNSLFEQQLRDSPLQGNVPGANRDVMNAFATGYFRHAGRA